MMPNNVTSPEQFRFVTGPARAGAQQVHLYNEGLVLFYYDASRLDRVQSVSPTVLEYFSEEVLQDDRLDQLFEDGSLVLHLLGGDGGADIEVVVGPDLTKTEKAGGRWLDPQSAWIALPSGRLRIETYNTAPFSDGDEPGGEINVPPGDYLVTVHAKDWEGMEMADEDMLERAAEAGIEVYDGERVDTVIVLTPLGKTMRPPRGVLFEHLYTAEPEPWPTPGGEVLYEGKFGVYRDTSFDGQAKQLKTIGQGMEALGMQCLGDFSLDRFGGVSVRGWAAKGLPFTGSVSMSPFTGLNVDLYTRFDDGSSLTTSNLVVSENAARGIYRRARADGSIAELHDAHMEGLEEHAKAGRTPVEQDVSRLGLIKEIDRFLAGQQG